MADNCSTSKGGTALNPRPPFSAWQTGSSSQRQSRNQLSLLSNVKDISSFASDGSHCPGSVCLLEGGMGACDPSQIVDRRELGQGAGIV